MSKNLWQQDRQSLFRNLIREYKEEGYSIKEARQLAKIDINEIMEDKEDFVNTIWKETFEDV
jgi:ribonuclease HII